MPAIDRRAVLAGALVAFVVVVPTAVIAELAIGDDAGDRSAWAFLSMLVIIAGLVAGGAVAGARQPNTPLVHGAVAATLVYVVVQGVGLVRGLLAGDEVLWQGLVFFFLLSASCGTFGGFIAAARRSRRLAEQPGSGSGSDEAERS